LPGIGIFTFVTLEGDGQQMDPEDNANQKYGAKKDKDPFSAFENRNHHARGTPAKNDRARKEAGGYVFPRGSKGNFFRNLFIALAKSYSIYYGKIKRGNYGGGPPSPQAARTKDENERLVADI